MKLTLVLTFSILFYFNTFCQETVFVKAFENGNGFFRERGGECFVITPNHVVFENFGNIKVIAKNRSELQGKLIESFEPDLAILKIESSPAFSCSVWQYTKNLNEVLDNVSSGVLEYRDEFGTTNFLHVNITSIDQESISIIPQNPENQFAKGMSGSSFYVNYKGKKTLLGMLMNVEEDLETGYVYQIDDIDRMLSPFFDGGETKPKTIGILIFKDDTVFSQVSNTLITNLRKNKKYQVSKKLPNIEFLQEEFSSIVEGRFNKVVPQKIKENLDEILLGEVIISKTLNSKKLYKINARLEGNIYSSSDFSPLKNVNTNGKGLNSDEKLAYDQSIKSLINSLENQLK